MRELTIAQCKELEKGEPIPSFRGRITKVYEHKTGTGEYGPWSMQNMIVEDETGHVQVTWGGEDDLSEFEGTTRLFECSQSNKHGLTGIKWDVRTSNGKRYEGIKLTGSCKIKLVNGTVESETLKGEPGYKGFKGEPIPHKASDVITDLENNNMFEARQHICQSANLYNLCVKAVDTMIAPGLPEIAQTSEQFQAAVGTLFIEASHSGLVSKMPARPVANGNEKVERTTNNQEEHYVVDLPDAPDESVPF